MAKAPRISWYVGPQALQRRVMVKMPCDAGGCKLLPPKNPVLNNSWKKTNICIYIYICICLFKSSRPLILNHHDPLRTSVLAGPMWCSINFVWCANKHVKGVVKLKSWRPYPPTKNSLVECHETWLLWKPFREEKQFASLPPSSFRCKKKVGKLSWILLQQKPGNSNDLP